MKVKNIILMILVVVILFIPTPRIAYSQGEEDTSSLTPIGLDDCGEEDIFTAIGCIPISDSTALTRFFLRWLIGIGGGIGLLMIGFASFRIATSQGDPRRLEGGQQLLASAIAGLIMLALAVFLLRFIGINVLGLF